MRMTVTTLALLVASLLLWPSAQGAPQPKPRLGINLNGPADWNTEIPFVDVFRLSRRWISQREGAGWGRGPELALDAHGWVTRLELACWADTPLCTIEGGHYPGGDYTLLYEGEGQIEFVGAASVASRLAGRMVVRVEPARGGIFLRLRTTNAQNYIRNIRVILPGFEETYRGNPFHPAFLKRWQGVACLRFMDWMQTNGSEIRTWADRPKPNDATFTTRGVAPEVMIDLANRLKADPWFCIPPWAAGARGGSWGILRYYDDDPAKSPKFMATLRWAKERGQPVNTP